MSSVRCLCHNFNLIVAKLFATAVYTINLSINLRNQKIG